MTYRDDIGMICHYSLLSPSKFGVWSLGVIVFAAYGCLGGFRDLAFGKVPSFGVLGFGSGLNAGT